MRKFGAPDTLLRDYRDWAVLLRRKQMTLGAVVVVSYEPARTLSEISEGAFSELKQVTTEVEGALKRAFGYDRINYLMLMMVDPDVHFHVVPRFAGVRRFAGREFLDSGWPGPPDFTRINDTNEAVNGEITRRISECWQT